MKSGKSSHFTEQPDVRTGQSAALRLSDRWTYLLQLGHWRSLQGCLRPLWISCGLITERPVVLASVKPPDVMSDRYCTLESSVPLQSGLDGGSSASSLISLARMPETKTHPFGRECVAKSRGCFETLCRFTKTVCAKIVSKGILTQSGFRVAAKRLSI